MLYTIVSLLVILALFFALRDTMAKLAKAESYARNNHKLMLAKEQSALAWQSYAESLEVRLAERENLQSFSHKAIEIMQNKYAALVTKTSKSNNDNGHKDNGNNNKPEAAQKPTTSDKTSKVTTLAGLGTIAPDEQNLIENWRKGNKPESDMVKWLIARRNQPKAVKA